MELSNENQMKYIKSDHEKSRKLILKAYELSNKLDSAIKNNSMRLSIMWHIAHDIESVMQGDIDDLYCDGNDGS